MYLDYSKWVFDANGIPEAPNLVLKTMGDDMIGVIPGVSNLELNIKFAEPSEMTFDVPAVLDGEPNWIYDQLTGYKIIYTEHYGIYVTMNPETEADGISDVKHMKAYSLEKTLESKKFYLEEGTFKFYNQTNSHDGDTIVGHIMEIALGWHMGYVSPTIAQRYRTFDEYDDYLLDFIYNTAPEKYRCVFVFDPYEKEINVYDADAELENLPIYLDFENLLTSVEVEEKTDELVTALRPYGADGLDVREVNPLGTAWIYDLSYFISNGDIPESLAKKWQSWQQIVQSKRAYYEGLSALRASATARLLAAQAALTDLQGELESLTAQQSTIIQAQASATSDTSKAYYQDKLDEVNADIAEKKQEISDQEGEIGLIQAELDESDASSCAAKIETIVQEMDIETYFGDDYPKLAAFFIEQDITEDTFVASDIDTSISGESYTVSQEPVSISGCAISKIDLTDDFGKTLYALSGGSFTTSGSLGVSGDIIRGTLEVSSGSSCVLSIYAGTIKAGDTTAPSGMLTLSGAYSGLTSNVSAVTQYVGSVDETYNITTYEGSSLSFTMKSGSMYLTANISDYQKYSVQKELYDYGVEVLDDLATPTYEFSVDSGNFLFAQEFAPFREKLELGKGIYLNLGHETINPYIIEMELSFEDRSKFTLQFSNRFKRHDGVNTLKDMLDKSYSTSRSFDASKYIYGQMADKTTEISRFMEGQLDAAKNRILAASNQSVVIDGAGIHVGGDSQDQLRIVDNMIAMTDDGWQTAKLAIGRFYSTGDTGAKDSNGKPVEIGEVWGVNAEMLAGKLIIGNNMILENTTNDGKVMQFKVDSSGAWLNNSTFVLQKDNGGRILIDPDYGIIAGGSKLYTTDGTTVTADMTDSDNDGLPDNANFYLDIQTGNAYFRGKLYSTSGSIGGWTIGTDRLSHGSGSDYVALGGSGSDYAIWAGSATPPNAKFYVKKDGTLYAKDGTFSGTLNAPTLSGNLTSDGDGWLIGCGISVNDGTFYVDQKGNVTMKGNLTLSSGAITWSDLDSTAQDKVTDAQGAASKAQGAAEDAQETADNAAAAAGKAAQAASNAADAASDAKDLAQQIADGTYVPPDTKISTTFINKKTIQSPTITGGILTGGTVQGATIYFGYTTSSGTWSGTCGTLTYETGAALNAGVTTATRLVALKSTSGGILLDSNTNMRFSMNGSLWIDKGPDDVYFYYKSGSETSASYHSLNTLLGSVTAVFAE